MMQNDRRQFLKKSGLALSLIPLARPGHFFETFDGSVESIGFQVWTIRESLFKDFSGTMKMMADMGFHEAEMCSPLGYSSAGFAPLHKISGKDMKTMIEDSGLICRSSHYTMSELRENLQDRIQWSLDMGIEQIILSSFWLPKDASVDDYRKAADELNSIAKTVKEAGLKTGFHNHHMEFEMRGSELIYDAILDQLDPDLVKMQFQVAVVNIGYKAANYFRKYPGRFISAHLADWDKETDTSVPLGQGEVDWEDFFEAAKIGGLQNVFVEVSPEFNAESARYLSSL